MAAFAAGPIAVRPTSRARLRHRHATVRPTRDPWEIARHGTSRYVDDATGRLATRMLHEFGSGAADRARKPWDQLIALAVLRYAARLLRGELREGRQPRPAQVPWPTCSRCSAYAQRNGLSPMLVGYSGTGRPVVQALGLLRDARTCVTRWPRPGGEEPRRCLAAR